MSARYWSVFVGLLVMALVGLPASPANASLRVRRITAINDAVGASSGLLSPRTPVGVVFCLIGEDDFSFARDVPFPDAIRDDATGLASTRVIGCDSIATSGVPIDFTPDNTPDFAAFAARLTNGVDERVWSFLAVVDAGNYIAGPNAGIGRQESHLSIHGGRKFRTDMLKYEPTMIRLIPSFTWQVTPDGQITVQSQSRWEFWGIHCGRSCPT
jgi:hypothetical protein